MKKEIKKDVAFAGLGKRQKYIINKIVVDEYYILKTLDTSNFLITISLVDDYGNEDIDLTQKELNALYKRGFLLLEPIRMSLHFEQEKYYFKKELVECALNACI